MCVLAGKDQMNPSKLILTIVLVIPICLLWCLVNILDFFRLEWVSDKIYPTLESLTRVINE